MEQPTQEQIKEFWEWCGYIYGTNKGCWKHPDGNNRTYLPQITLNNLFKYAVPKLSYCFLSAVWIDDNNRVEYSCSVGHPDGEGKTDLMEDPALALFWALWQVKEG